MKPLVISGGQPGADLAAWQTARRHGLPTGGYMTFGYLALNVHGIMADAHPEYDPDYGATEHPTSVFIDRLRDNTLACSPHGPGTGRVLLFNHTFTLSPYSRTVIDVARSLGVTIRLVTIPDDLTLRSPRPSLLRESPGPLFVTGPREHAVPGTTFWVASYLDRLFQEWKQP